MIVAARLQVQLLRVKLLQQSSSSKLLQ